MTASARIRRWVIAMYSRLVGERSPATGDGWPIDAHPLLDFKAIHARDAGWAHHALGDLYDLEVARLWSNTYWADEEKVAIREVDGWGMRYSFMVFGSISDALEFPSYFGFNWDALDECLSDFAESHKSGLILIVKNADRLLDGDLKGLKIFLDIFRYVSEEEWPEYSNIYTKNETTVYIPLRVIFHSTYSKADKLEEKLGGYIHKHWSVKKIVRYV